MNTSQRVIIVSGGSTGPWALKRIQKSDWLIGADRGALFLIDSGLTPDMAIGDFDSVSEEEKERIARSSKRFIECDPIAKDCADTEMAFRYAVNQGAKDIVLLGVLGSRWDHSLANVHLLRLALEHNIHCLIADAHNELMLMDERAPALLCPTRHTHVSLLPLTPEVSGVTLTGFQYPLMDARLRLGDSLGISNVLIADEGTVSLRSGQLLIIRSSDEAEE